MTGRRKPDDDPRMEHAGRQPRRAGAGADGIEFGQAHEHRIALDAMTEAISVVDRNMRIVLSNSSFRQLCADAGFRAGADGGLLFEACPFLSAKERDDYPNVFTSGESVVSEQTTTFGGTERVYETRKVPIFRRGGVTQVLTVIRDITAHRLAEEEVKTQRDRAQRYLDVAGVIIMVLDTQGRIQLLNRRGCELLGYEEKEALNKNYFDLCIPKELRAGMKEGFRKAVTEEPWSGARRSEDLVVTKSGEERSFECHSTLLVDDAGDVTGLITSADDVTERKLAEAKLRSYREMLRNLATELSQVEERERRLISAGLHDGVIQTLAVSRMMLAEAREADSRESAGVALEKACDHIESAIQDIRGLAFDLSPAMLYELGLEAALERLVERHREGGGVHSRFRSDKRPKPLPVESNAILFHAVRELLLNVAKYAEANTVEVSVRLEGASVEVAVEDDGVGFDLSAAGSRAGKAGGFGLFSIKERLASIGGELRISTSPGRGTRATLAVPLADKGPGEARSGRTES